MESVYETARRIMEGPPARVRWCGLLPSSMPSLFLHVSGKAALAGTLD